MQRRLDSSAQRITVRALILERGRHLSFACSEGNISRIKMALLIPKNVKAVIAQTKAGFSLLKFAVSKVEWTLLSS